MASAACTKGPKLFVRDYCMRLTLTHSKDMCFSWPIDAEIAQSGTSLKAPYNLDWGMSASVLSGAIVLSIEIFHDVYSNKSS